MAEQNDVLDIATYMGANSPKPPVSLEPAPDPVSAKAPEVPREIEIAVTYPEPGTGVRKTMTVISRVPDFTINALIARSEAGLCGGMPFDGMSPERKQWIRAFARVSRQLKDPPKAFLEYLGSNNEALDWLAAHCQAHEDLFFRPGAAAGGATQSVTQLAITSPVDRWVVQGAG